MPGGRLTLTDRRYVAEALAQGLGYAEIARRLRRPTSTISREVARNGGRDGYRAEAAQRSTSQRARRRPATPTPAAVPTDRDTAEVVDFRQRYAAMMIDTGMPPMPARVLADLLTCDSGRRTAAELVHRLRVSPAAISKAVAYLETLGMLHREHEPGQRRQSYRVNDGVWAEAWHKAIVLQRRWAASAAEGARLLGTTTAAGARLAELAEFTDLMNGVLLRELDGLLAEFERRRTDS